MENSILPLVAHEVNASFPSRHTSLISTITFSYIFYKSRWALLFILFLFWTGFARIFVGVHYPLDIIGGIFLGFVSSWIARLALRFLKARFGAF